MGGGGMGGSGIKKVDPYQIGAKVKAIWSGDGQYYAAQIDSVRQVDGTKFFLVTFTEYGNQEEVPQASLQVTPAPPSGGIGGGMTQKEKVGMEALLKLQANNLKSSDDRSFSPNQEETILNSVQKALAARRAGMCFSLYGHDAVSETEEHEWGEEDDSWIDV